ncbi:hypothetical protein MHU86_18420 [Fragilaria crotonensis]|nr:hypothetical protein MHU86_18420 [Fragilaria crotonensis]
MCTDYGRTRHFAFRGQGFFFCNPCDLWDDRLPDSNIKGSRLSTRFRCTANHSCFSHPTSVRNEYCKLSTVKSNLARDALNSSAINSRASSNLSGCAGVLKGHRSVASSGSSSSGGGLDDGELSDTPSDAKESRDTNSDNEERDETGMSDCPHAADDEFPIPNATRAYTMLDGGGLLVNAETLRQLLREKDIVLNQLQGKVVLLKERIQDMSRKNKVLEDTAKKTKDWMNRQGGKPSPEQQRASLQIRKVSVVAVTVGTRFSNMKCCNQFRMF